MSVSLSLGKDINGNVTFALPISQYKYITTLAADTAQSVTIPLNCTQAFFSFSNGEDVFVCFKDGEDATVPTASFELTDSELNPVARYGLTGGQTISCITRATNAYVCVLFYP